MYKKISPLLFLTTLPPLYYIIFNHNIINKKIDSSHSILWLHDSQRILELFIYPYGSHGNSAIDMYIYILLILSPFLIGLKPRISSLSSAPFWVLIIFWFILPDYAMKTEFLYERFSLVFIPVYICIFKKKNPNAIEKKQSSFEAINSYLVPLLSIFLIASLYWQSKKYDEESISFKYVLSKIPDNGRLLSIIQDTGSPAARNSTLYINYGSWYQAEKGGIADFSFAWFPPQPVRFKMEALPYISPKDPWNMEKINWSTFNAEKYDYFLTRRNSRQPNLLIPYQCTKLIAQSGNWHAYSRVSCLQKVK